MAKKSKKNLSFAEQEMEAYAQASPDIHRDPVSTILGVIDRHAEEIHKAKKHYLEQRNDAQYAVYGEIEAAFDILKDDLKREGFCL